MTDFDKKTELIAEALQESVNEALDRKRRLGQYAAIWDWAGEKVVYILPSNEITNTRPD